ncbi:hypothetical protein SCHPADRAFT_628824 [Schizopora paradoxa]|uniref:Uncharacterized protein n=1 Tax=Schizopora paradoxa TaxID=27342 RepID=A0A0H2R7S5_9AGAM|nr:hypothetical protein SCHPADRAFT_628824 [Schizopora paradoxa]
MLLADGVGGRRKPIHHLLETLGSRRRTFEFNDERRAFRIGTRESHGILEPKTSYCVLLFHYRPIVMRVRVAVKRARVNERTRIRRCRKSESPSDFVRDHAQLEASQMVCSSCSSGPSNHRSHPDTPCPSPLNFPSIQCILDHNARPTSGVLI